MVIFVFLRNVWATVIPSLALPFSIIGTFAVMYLLGYSLDNLSMMALILSVGFVVDDAIVMLENIYRHVEMGEDPLTASLVGSREIGFTIVSMTLSLAAVFIPVLFMGGVLGRLFREFSVTICVAILISGVVSVTLTPMLCSRFLKKPTQARRGAGFGQATERGVRGPAATATTGRCRSCSGTAPRRWSRPPRVLRADRACCSSSCRRASSPSRTPTRSPSRPKRRRARRTTSWSSTRTRSPTSSAQDPNVAGARLDDRRHARRRRSAGRTSARSSCTSSRAASARSWPDDIIEKLRPAAREDSRHARCTCRTRRRSASAAR